MSYFYFYFFRLPIMFYFLPSKEQIRLHFLPKLTTPNVGIDLFLMHFKPLSDARLTSL